MSAIQDSYSHKTEKTNTMNKHWLILIALFNLVLVAIHFTSCEREPVYVGEIITDPTDTIPLPVEHPCDPDSVYFALQILPILQSNCAMSGCHDTQSHKEGVILVDYATTRATGGIRLNNPSNSEIYKTLNDTDPEERMPPSPRGALTAAQKALILKWIQQGASDLSCDGTCDTLNVHFAASIQPIMTLQCTGCHSAVSPGGNIRLTNYAEIKAQVDNGKLWGSVSHAPGYVGMPYPAGSALMAPCKLDQIRIWIENGAPND